MTGNPVGLKRKKSKSQTEIQGGWVLSATTTSGKTLTCLSQRALSILSATKLEITQMAFPISHCTNTCF